MTLLPRRTWSAWRRPALAPVDAATLAGAAAIVADVRARGAGAAIEHGLRLGDLATSEARVVLTREELQGVLATRPRPEVELLQRTAARIEAFARAQRGCLTELTFEQDGVRAGHTIAPVERAGCYAPGGRYPLPSSVLMTAVTARAAGVREVWVASPRPSPVTLAAAAIAGADGVLTLGGAQAIASLAIGTFTPPVDVICGPGNRWVTAAKQLVAGEVGIDMLAGPSELCVLADASADPVAVAADLLAQAEHDPDAVPVLISTNEDLLASVQTQLEEQLATLPTADVAREALRQGGAVLVGSIAAAAAIANELAPEHLQLAVADPGDWIGRLEHYGALFHGAGAEVLGDYGAGPNHVLPTGRGARFTGGLSVFTFLRIRTWLSAAHGCASDAADLARLEGLEAHARAAEVARS